MPIDQAWAILLDVQRVAPCLPGAAVEEGADGEFKGTMTVKIGPITARYAGTVKIEEADEAAHRAVMRAQAKDARGQGTASASITSEMQEAADGTRVKVTTDMRITGPAAQFGRGVMQDVSAKLMRQFAECLAHEMSAEREPGAPTGGSAAEPAAEEPSGGPAAGGERAPAPAPPPEPAPPPRAAEPPRRAPEVLDLAEASRE